MDDILQQLKTLQEQVATSHMVQEDLQLAATTHFQHRGGLLRLPSIPSAGSSRHSSSWRPCWTTAQTLIPWPPPSRPPTRTLTLGLRAHAWDPWPIRAGHELGITKVPQRQHWLQQFCRHLLRRAVASLQAKKVLHMRHLLLMPPSPAAGGEEHTRAQWQAMQVARKQYHMGNIHACLGWPPTDWCHDAPDGGQIDRSRCSLAMARLDNQIGKNKSANETEAVGRWEA
jgi:hypothetical protein